MSKEKKISEKIKKTILVTGLCACFSVGAFAWFSISNKAQVDSLAISVGTEGNLLIANDTGTAPDTFGTDISITETENSACILNPVTTKDGLDFYSPVYTGGKVTNVSKITDTTELKTKYIFEKTFYLKVDNQGRGNASEYKVYLLSSNGSNGTYIKDKDAIPSGDTAANAIRISFTYDTTTKIYEPNTDKHNVDTNKAVDNISDALYAGYTTLKQTSAGVFKDSSNGNDSDYLFTIPADTNCKVTMRVWLEGRDEDCVDSIKLDDLSGQIGFSSVSTKNAGN